MLYREIMAVCSEIHTKHINTVFGQNVELLNVQPSGTYIYHCALRILFYTCKFTFINSVLNFAESSSPVNLEVT